MTRNEYNELSELYDEIYEQAVVDTIEYLEEGENYTEDDVYELLESGEINKYEASELLEGLTGKVASYAGRRAGKVTSAARKAGEKIGQRISNPGTARLKKAEDKYSKVENIIRKRPLTPREEARLAKLKDKKSTAWLKEPSANKERVALLNKLKNSKVATQVGKAKSYVGTQASKVKNNETVKKMLDKAGKAGRADALIAGLGAGVVGGGVAGSRRGSRRGEARGAQKKESELKSRSLIDRIRNK